MRKHSGTDSDRSGLDRFRGTGRRGGVGGDAARRRRPSRSTCTRRPSSGRRRESSWTSSRSTRSGWPSSRSRATCARSGGGTPRATTGTSCFSRPWGATPNITRKAGWPSAQKAADASGLSEEAFARKLDACSSWKEDVLRHGAAARIREEGLRGDGLLPHRDLCLAAGQAGRAVQGAGDGERLRRRDEAALQHDLRPRVGRVVGHLSRSAATATSSTGPSARRSPRRSGRRRRRKAGFNSPEEIGPYMRTLIDFHRDTMGVAIK